MAGPPTAFRLTSPGMADKDEVLKALQGDRALRAASLVFRYAH